ncbi:MULTISPECIES: hypothetical protein [Prauserella salsuginis group]|uniref:Uncharacterized protein n=1 Tax=Prauserella salsuginis TaxID=387889 RepID=A0ABW6G2R1_9PSEU|nr:MULTISPECIES: hypothetical protein [Prauserella salsuginis group]MCR3719745.1 hypothetical protein [Prauserella flava]MCR3736712.1 hypothetical protein [Prauserella salsuginis]
MTAGSRDAFDFFDPTRTTTDHASGGGRSRGRHARNDDPTPPGDDRAEGSMSGTLPSIPAQGTPPAEPAHPTETTAPISAVPAPQAGTAESAGPQAATAAHRYAPPPKSSGSYAGAASEGTPHVGSPARSGHAGGQVPVRRQRVALSETPAQAASGTASRPEPSTPATPGPKPGGTDVNEADDGASVHPVDGLGTFDLGSVPASVTPPSTWRKAAWFASLSSGAVVVALLVAGTLLVGPDEQSAAVDGWPDRNGAVAPLLPEERDDRGGRHEQGPPGTSSTSESSSTSAGPSDTRHGTESPAPVRDGRPQGGAPRPTESAPPGSNPPGSNPPSGPPSGSAPPSASPTKPSPTPASTSTSNRVYFGRAHDTEAMAQRSQAFFDRVTEDPRAAHELTSGELREQGAEGLERTYAGIAYFEVEHIAIDQYEGVSDNTLRVTYEDGSTARQTRRLTFDDSEKISADGT